MKSLEEFKNSLNEENLNEMKKLSMPLKWAYDEYQALLNDNSAEDITDVNQAVKSIINDYINGLLYREFNKFEMDFE